MTSRSPLDAPDEQPLGAVVLEQEAAVALERALLDEAPGEHQRDEDVERVEVGEVATALAHAGERGGVDEQDADRDRQVEVEHAARSPCSAERKKGQPPTSTATVDSASESRVKSRKTSPSAGASPK